MTPQESELVLSNLTLVESVLNQLFSNSQIPGLAREDLLQSGRLALCYAAICYDHERPFQPYARVVIHNKIVDDYRNIIPAASQTISLNEVENDCLCTEAMAVKDSPVESTVFFNDLLEAFDILKTIPTHISDKH